VISAVIFVAGVEAGSFDAHAHGERQLAQALEAAGFGDYVSGDDAE
jgi:hypothetical protein